MITTKPILKKIFAALISVSISFVVSGQELHFSQYFNNPLIINPANTGFAPDADYRIGGSYRTQFSSIGGTPYKTMSLWGDVQLFNNRFENAWVGIGGALLRDVAGDGTLTATRAFGSAAYHQLLGYNGLLSMGFNIGFVNKRLDISKLNFNSQWNGSFFDISIPSGEPFMFNSTSYFDLQAGINYAYFPTDDLYFNLGFSARNINRPSESFFSPGIGDQRVPNHFTLFVNASYKLNNLWIVNPNLYVNKINNQTQVVMGMNAQRNLSGDGLTQMIVGLYYRFKDAAIPMVGYQLNDYKITFSYDATVSSLSAANQTRGAYEISLVKTGVFSTGKSVKCPTVKF